MPFDDTIFLKKNVDILSFFTDDQLRKVTAVIDRRLYNKGQTVMFQGEVSNNFYVIKKGKVQVSSRAGKDKADLAELKAGDFFGEMSLLESITATATIKVVEDDTEILTIARDVFHEMLKQNPPLEFMLRQRITERKKHREEALKKDPPPEASA